VLIRSNAPVFGANATPYEAPGRWQIGIASRNLVSNDHYSGTVEQVQRQTLQNYVTNRQNLVDLSITRHFTDRFSLAVGVPYVNSSWASRDPRSPLPGPRVEIKQNGRGLGDISVTGRYWLLDTLTHPDWNVLGGVGIKTASGNARTQDLYPDRDGLNNQLRYVDQSVQTGDGGWGLMTEAHMFWKVRRVFVFGSASYLANPRNTNGTPSLLVARGGPPPAAASFDKLVNSVPDQYLGRAGGTVPVWGGIAATVAWRVEGLRRFDLFGESNGFRRPGESMFIEPGVSYSHGPSTISFNVPIAFYYIRRPDPNTGLPGDATFPRQIFLTSYTRRLGGRSSAPGLKAPDSPVPVPKSDEAPAAPAQPPAAKSGSAELASATPEALAASSAIAPFFAHPANVCNDALVKQTDANAQ
jgi:hypothetical protein